MRILKNGGRSEDLQAGWECAEYLNVARASENSKLCG